MIYVNAIFFMLIVLLGLFIAYDILEPKLRKVGTPAYNAEIIILLFLYAVAVCVALGFLHICIQFLGYVPFELFM